MATYADRLPRDRDGIAMVGQVPAAPALQRYSTENGTVSSVITVSSITTAIEIAAVGGAAAIRWVPTTDTQASVVTAVSGANYDHVIPSGTFRRFVLPIERTKQNDTSGSVLGIQQAMGLYNRVAVKTMGVASVLVSEYN